MKRWFLRNLGRQMGDCKCSKVNSGKRKQGHCPAWEKINWKGKFAFLQSFHNYYRPLFPKNVFWHQIAMVSAVMDRTLTPSAWTTLMHNPNELLENGLLLKKYYFSGKLRGWDCIHCTDHTILSFHIDFSSHFEHLYWKKTIAAHKTSRFKPREGSAEHASMESSGKTFNNKMCFPLIIQVTTGRCWLYVSLN